MTWESKKVPFFQEKRRGTKLVAHRPLVKWKDDGGGGSAHNFVLQPASRRRGRDGGRRYRENGEDTVLKQIQQAHSSKA